MIVQTIAFYVFAAVAVISALLVVGNRNPVYSVLFLILTFFNVAALFVLIGAEFLAMMLVVVYVGAVAVLFLFVVMMLDINFVELRHGFVKRNLGVPGRCGVFLGVGGVHAIHLGGLEDQLCPNFGAAQCGGRVGGEEGVASTGRKDHYLAFFQVLQSLGAHIGLDNLLDRNGRHDTGDQPLLVHRIGQRQRIHDGCQHAHVVRRRAIHPDRTTGHPTEDVAAADDHRHLDTHVHNFCDFFHHPYDGCPVDSELVIAHQRLTRQLEQDSLVGWLGFWHE